MADKTTIKVERSWTIGKRIFLSGPMTGYENYNQYGFVTAQIRLKLLGAEHVYNPIMQWLCEPQHVSITRTHESYMLECLNELTRYDADGTPLYDAVVQLDKWEDSEGARMEAEVAKACGIPLMPLAQLIKAEGDGVTATGEADGDGTDDVTGHAGDDDGIKVPDHVSSKKPLSFDQSKLWTEWDGIRILWESVDTDGKNIRHNDVPISEMHPVNLVTLSVIQDALEDMGIKGMDVARARVIDVASCGMNAFESTIRCDLGMQDDSLMRVSFEMSGPAIFDKGTPMEDQIDVSDLQVKDVTD